MLPASRLASDQNLSPRHLHLFMEMTSRRFSLALTPVMMRFYAPLALVCIFVVQVGSGQDNQENVDHAGIISRWDRQSLERGKALFQIACAPCHGTNGVEVVNPQARPFAREKFQNGNDPYSMFKTITQGFKNMPSQTWMTPEQRYEVIQFVRETLVRPLNPSEYVPVDRAYLDSLPRYQPARAGAAKAAKEQQRDFGPALNHSWAPISPMF